MRRPHSSASNRSTPSPEPSRGDRRLAERGGRMTARIREGAMRIAVTVCCLAASVASASAWDDSPLVGPPRPIPAFAVVRTFDTTEYGPSSLSFSPNGRVLAVADGKRIRFWDPASGKEIGAQTAEAWKTGELAGPVAFLDQQTVGLSAGADTHLEIRTYPAGKELARLDMGKGHS